MKRACFRVLLGVVVLVTGLAAQAPERLPSFEVASVKKNTSGDSRKRMRETRELPVYELVLPRADRRLGPEMRTPAADCDAAIAAGIPPPRQPGEPPPCGLMGGPARTIAGGATMQQVVGNLSHRVERLVVDKTGLAGRFAFTLAWTPEQMPTEAPPPGIPSKSAGRGTFQVRRCSPRAPLLW